MESLLLYPSCLGDELWGWFGSKVRPISELEINNAIIVNLKIQNISEKKIQVKNNHPGYLWIPRSVFLYYPCIQ